MRRCGIHYVGRIICHFCFSSTGHLRGIACCHIGFFYCIPCRRICKRYACKSLQSKNAYDEHWHNHQKNYPFFVHIHSPSVFCKKALPYLSQKRQLFKAVVIPPDRAKTVRKLPSPPHKHQSNADKKEHQQISCNQIKRLIMCQILKFISLTQKAPPQREKIHKYASTHAPKNDKNIESKKNQKKRKKDVTYLLKCGIISRYSM